MPSRPVNPEALGADIADHLNFLIDAAQERPTFAARGKIFEELCRHYRALGICVVAAEGNSDAFFHWLIQSAITRRFYLEGAQAEVGAEPRFRRAGFIDPLLDAVAARQWNLASEVAALSSPVWLEGEEYEDDFLYADFWKRLLIGDRKLLPGLLARWRTVLEGGEEPRLHVANALLEGQAEDFAEALRSLLDVNEAKARDSADPRMDSIVTDDYPFHPNRWISVEGLAWLSIGEREGVVAEGQFPACPPSARSAVYSRFTPLAYPGAELS